MGKKPKSDFGFWGKKKLSESESVKHLRRETNFWEILCGKNKRRQIYFEGKIKIKEDNFN